GKEKGEKEDAAVRRKSPPCRPGGRHRRRSITVLCFAINTSPPPGDRRCHGSCFNATHQEGHDDIATVRHHRAREEGAG
ncbi:unnamed protein product, partial [Urochloa humidicola]